MHLDRFRTHLFHSVALMLVARLLKAEAATLLTPDLWHCGDWPALPSPDLQPVLLCWNVFGAACLTHRLSGRLFCLLLHLPVSHYDVPRQGLLGELILIQQQIQRHEEEVRRAAAANNARPPPPEPAPILPQQTRKVKVTTLLDLPYCTKISLMITAAENKQSTFSKSP